MDVKKSRARTEIRRNIFSTNQIQIETLITKSQILTPKPFILSLFL